MIPRSTARRYLVYASVVALVAVAAAFAGSLSPPGVSGAVDAALASIVALGLLAVSIAVYALEIRSRGWGSDGDETDPGSLREIQGMREDEIRSVSEEDAVVGADFDSDLSLATDDSVDAASKEEARERVAETLRETASIRYAEAFGVSREEAEAVVRSGDWTRDERASALLSDGKRLPLKTRVLDVLNGRDTFREGVDAALGEIESMGLGGTIPSPVVGGDADTSAERPEGEVEAEAEAEGAP